MSLFKLVITTFSRYRICYLVSAMAVAILLAFIIPNWLGAENKKWRAEISGNFTNVMIALESCATDRGGGYPSHVKDAMPYILKLTHSNPKVLDSIIDLGPMGKSQIDNWYQAMKDKKVNPGQIYYAQIKEGSYALIGADVHGHLTLSFGAVVADVTNKEF